MANDQNILQPKFIIEEVTDPEEIARSRAQHERHRRNSDWLQAHWSDVLPQARGTDGRIYPWGNEWDKSKANVGTSGTTAVDSYPAGKSPGGVYDMAGNVWEWVQDWYAKDYYNQGPARNPQGPTDGQSKILRGGSWHFDPGDARVSDRFWGGPGSRNGYVGFRCAQ